MQEDVATDVYERMLKVLSNQLSDIIGLRVVNSMLNWALKRAQLDHPILATLDTASIMQGRIREKLTSTPPEALLTLLDAFVARVGHIIGFYLTTGIAKRTLNPLVEEALKSNIKLPKILVKPKEVI